MNLEDRLSVIFEDTAALGVKDEVKSTDEIMLRQAIIAELDAISLYEQMAASTVNPDIQKIMLDIAKEEKVHVGELEGLLEGIDTEHASSVEDGKDEAAKKISEIEPESQPVIASRFITTSELENGTLDTTV